ncbi:uncharacterized protein LOC142982294 [Anticarsia gemmatalis]|uniref:uncharacterized protein LOC142982294 n=1 Tax=Anticarsia gemmatalis TaxID=129554 RepID=UPI003F77740F
MMKYLGVLFIFILVGLSLAKPHDRGCVHAFGKCYQDCPEGTHSYTPNYSSPWHWEPTCKEPNPQVQTSSQIFDYSACYCDPPTVRDQTTDTCVPLDKCPKMKKA